MHRIANEPAALRTEIRNNAFAINYEERYKDNPNEKTIYLDIHYGFDTLLSINSTKYPKEKIHKIFSTIVDNVKEGGLTEKIIEDIKEEIKNEI